MEQISFFGDIGCKEPPEPKPKKKNSRLIPEDLPDSAREYLATQTAREARREGLRSGDKRSMEKKILIYMRRRGGEPYAHQVAQEMFSMGLHYSPERQSIQPRMDNLEKKGEIEKTGNKVLDPDTGIHVSTYRVVIPDGE